jgi:hypothetical protein
MHLFWSFILDVRSVLSWIAKAAFAAPLVPIVVNLGPPWYAGGYVNNKSTIIIVTAIVQAFALTSTFFLYQSNPSRISTRRILVSLIISVSFLLLYVVGLTVITEIQPNTSNRLPSGLSYTDKFIMILESNSGNIVQSKEEFGNDPFRIYNSPGVYFSLIAMPLCWLVFFGSFMFYLGIFSIHTGWQGGKDPIEILGLADDITSKLRADGIRTVSDLTSKTLMELKELEGIGQGKANTIVKGLATKGLKLRE